MPRAKIAINVLILILAFSSVSGKALAEEVELKYDDGTKKGSMAPGGWHGDYNFC